MRIKYLALVLLTGFGSVEAAAQSARPRKDIPAIAKTADGSVVCIVMSDKDGKPVAQGSGFFVSEEGLIITNYHVIAQGSSAVVKLPGGAVYVVDGVVASDKERDVAIIKAHGENFRTLALGDSDGVQVGEEVVAIGNPLCLESTVSNGIVSEVRAVKEVGGQFLQITPVILPGGSGGPLFNMAGDVVGIATMDLKSGQNLNLAIPINDMKRVFSNRSGELHKLPIEVESKTFVKFHVVAYDPRSHIVVVRYGNKLFTAIVVEVRTCKPINDCIENYSITSHKLGLQKVSSIAGTLVGQDIASREEVPYVDREFEGSFLINKSDAFLILGIYSRPRADGHSHIELWQVAKVEGANP